MYSKFWKTALFLKISLDGHTPGRSCKCINFRFFLKNIILKITHLKLFSKFIKEAF